MIVDRSYKICAFGDFSAVTPTTENMLKILEFVKAFELVPSLYQEIRLNKDGTPPDQIQRIILINSDGSIQVPIGTNRIDVLFNVTTDIQLSPSDIDSYNQIAFSVLTSLFDGFELKANRLALNTESLIVELSPEQVIEVLKKYSNPISIYTPESMGEWNSRLMVRKDVQWGEKTESLNIITNINKQIVAKKVEDQQIPFDGFGVHVDINTIGEKTLARFGPEDFPGFTSCADELWSSIMREVC